MPCSPSYPREGQVRSGLLCSMLLTKIFFSIGGKFFFCLFAETNSVNWPQVFPSHELLVGAALCAFYALFAAHYIKIAFSLPQKAMCHPFHAPQGWGVWH